MSYSHGSELAGERVLLDVADEIQETFNDVNKLRSALAKATWDDTSALQGEIANASWRVNAARDGAILNGIPTATASSAWRDLARSQINDFTAAAAATTPTSAPADALVAVQLARLSLAQAAVTIAHAKRLDLSASVAHPHSPPRRLHTTLPRARSAATALGVRARAEIAHIFVDRPHSILIRLVITLAISMSMVVGYRVVGWSSYQEVGPLALYFYAAAVGSVVCTNALCFEAGRVRSELGNGQPLWRILMAKNLAMGVLVSCTAVPVIVYLALTTDLSVAAMVDQFAIMLFVWFGVGNLLSVIFPLRTEPMTARLHDGTWRTYLLSFGISYGVGLAVNLVIYWNLWARESATANLSVPTWVVALLLLTCGVIIWMLLTVLAVSAARQPPVRDIILRELIVYQKKGRPARQDG